MSLPYIDQFKLDTYIIIDHHGWVIIFHMYINRWRGVIGKWHEIANEFNDFKRQTEKNPSLSISALTKTEKQSWIRQWTKNLNTIIHPQ